MLHEPYVRSAVEYVEMAEAENGPIPSPVPFDYVWGDALAELDRVEPDARIINLETSVTTSDEALPKGINYRMHPRNVPCLTAAGVDCCGLANNHVLDWGEAGLLETLGVLGSAGLAATGAGRTAEDARRPAVLEIDGGRVLVFAYGTPSAGVPPDWAATDEGPGVNLLHHASRRSADRVADQVRSHRRPGDLVVVSIHWGSNWGYEVPRSHRRFAHRLIESESVDVIHGHSSHHPRGIEIYRDRLILYGCGDFLNDYEGISGHATYRPDLVLMYFPSIGESGLIALRMVPMKIRRFRLGRAAADDARWLQQNLDLQSAGFRTRVHLADNGALEVRWPGGRAGRGQL